MSKENLGQTPALIAAAALVVDYILTAAVSVTSGVSNLVSAFPGLAPHTLSICLDVVVLLTAINLRGIHESGRVFAAPHLRVHRRGDVHAAAGVRQRAALRLKTRLLFLPGVIVTSVPLVLHGVDVEPDRMLEMRA